MGYYQMKTKHNTQAGRKDAQYIEIFDRMRDLEYTVAQARIIAWESCYWLKLHPDLTAEQAIRQALK